MLATFVPHQACLSEEVLPLPSDQPLLRIAFGSCGKPHLPQPIWNSVVDAVPDVFVFVGDKISPETYDDQQDALNQIVKYKERYYAYYHESGGDFRPRLWSTNTATSKDLVHWTKYEGNPLFPIRENKSSGVFVHDGKRFRLYTMHGKVVVHLAEIESPSGR